jgi:hypothetical protein
MDMILQQSDLFLKDQRGDDPIWSTQATYLMEDFMAADMWLHQQGKLSEFWDCIKTESRAEYGSLSDNLSYNRDNYFRCMSTLVALSAGDSPYGLAVYVDRAMAAGVPSEHLIRLHTILALCERTRSGVIWVANGILQELSSEELASQVSLNPMEAPENMLSVKDALNNGDVVVYGPKNASVVADIIGRCYKTKFFHFAFNRVNQTRPFFYIVDEAHRFLTSGREDGEQSLLDRCRAYRTGVVLATQSMSSMAYRLGDKFTPLQIIVNNCGNSLYFRTTDTATQDNLMKRIPNAPVLGRPHVLQVRPLSSMGVGCCYALRPNGSWGLFQVQLD